MSSQCSFSFAVTRQTTLAWAVAAPCDTAGPATNHRGPSRRRARAPSRVKPVFPAHRRCPPPLRPAPGSAILRRLSARRPWSRAGGDVGRCPAAQAAVRPDPGRGPGPSPRSRPPTRPRPSRPHPSRGPMQATLTAATIPGLTPPVARARAASRFPRRPVAPAPRPRDLTPVPHIRRPPPPPPWAAPRARARHRSSPFHDQAYAHRCHPRGRNPRGGAGR